jgi:putative ABC transport system ATP-binding protein
MSSPLVDLVALERVYGSADAEVRALAGVDLRIDAGEFVAVMGPSGSGKSTCLNVLGGLDQPTGGHFYFRGVDLSGLGADELARYRRAYLGFVFQGYNLLPRTSALENVELPLRYRGHSARQRRTLALRALEEVGLGSRAQHTPAELSGGQQQRAAIARAIVTNPEILLADEPTGNLDTARKEEILRLLLRLHRERGITIVMVTHEPEMAAYAQRTVHFRDGLIERDERKARA